MLDYYNYCSWISSYKDIASPPLNGECCVEGNAPLRIGLGETKNDKSAAIAENA